MRAVLERAGYSVEVAEDGYVALQKISQSAPDLVITDLRMPNMNGFELLVVVRLRYPEIPTIVISGEFNVGGVNAGPIADAFFQKGQYSPLDLQERIAQLLQAPPQRFDNAQSGTLWTSTGSAPVMLTCTKCLRTSPIELSPQSQQQQKRICIFCGAELEVEIVAIGVAR